MYKILMEDFFKETRDGREKEPGTPVPAPVSGEGRTAGGEGGWFGQGKSSAEGDPAVSGSLPMPVSARRVKPASPKRPVGGKQPSPPRAAAEKAGQAQDSGAAKGLSLSDAWRGIVFSEILGPPKGRRFPAGGMPGNRK